jgi:hypothetical protein
MAQLPQELFVADVIALGFRFGAFRSRSLASAFSRRFSRPALLTTAATSHLQTRSELQGRQRKRLACVPISGGDAKRKSLKNSLSAAKKDDETVN